MARHRCLPASIALRRRRLGPALCSRTHVPRAVCIQQFAVPRLAHAPRFATSAARPLPEGRGEVDEADRSSKGANLTSWKLLQLARPEAVPLAGAVAALGVSTSAGLLWPILMGKMMDVAVLEASDHFLSSPLGIAAALLGISTASSLARAAQTILLTVSGERISKRLRQDLFTAVLRQEMAFFDRSRTGELVNRLAADTAMAQNALTTSAAQGLRGSFNAVGASCMMLWISPQLTVVSLAAMPAAAIGSFYFGRYIKERQQEVQTALAASTAKAQEVIANIRTVRQFTMEGKEGVAYARETEHVFDIARGISYISAGYQGGMNFAWNLSIAAVVGFGGSQLMAGVITPGDLTAFMMYSLYLAGSAYSLSDVYTEFMKAVGACGRVFEIMDRTPQLHQLQPANAGTLGDSSPLESGEALTMELRDVHFAYPTRPERPVFSGLSLTLMPGQHLALVGASGSGKSSVAALMTRLYDPDRGGVFMNGVDVRTLSQDALRSRIAVVAQEPVLFGTSILENIRYGSPESTDQEVVAAAHEANADGFVKTFPDGYATEVGERGAQLSGGQKQRIAVARAILKGSPIIILDEATSALDAESEHSIQHAIERLSARRSVISIAHRISTIRAADCIAVLEGGMVVESGSYDELTGGGHNGRRFLALVRRQLDQQGPISTESS